MNKSETISELSKALVQFQAKVISVKKESVNPFFKNKYASLSTIIESVQAPLAECGLAVIQLPAGVNQLETILLHESGEFISETYEMKPTKSDPQGLGSAITYQRRYALGAILCLNIDEDDDGNRASEPVKAVKVIQAKPKTKVPMPDDRFADMMQYVRTHSPLDGGNAIGKARLAFTFDNQQESILADINDNIETVNVEEVI